MDSKHSINYKLAESIRQARIAGGYKSQQAFADALVDENGRSIHLKTVQGWERGTSIPDLASLIRISDLLDVDLDYLTGRIDKPTHDLQFISDETGLSVEAIKRLRHQKKISDTETPTILSRIICHRLFVQLIQNISKISRPISFTKAVIDHLINDAPYVDSPEDLRAIYQYSTDKVFDNIVDDIINQEKQARKNP